MDWGISPFKGQDMKLKPVTAQDAIALLNEASKLDPEAIRALVEHRVPCNCALADDPTIPVSCTENGDPRGGMAGVINGLFGVDEDTHGPVPANIPDGPAAPATISLNSNFEN
jgi:hypothetical protein